MNNEAMSIGHKTLKQKPVDVGATSGRFIDVYCILLQRQCGHGVISTCVCWIRGAQGERKGDCGRSVVPGIFPRRGVLLWINSRARAYCACNRYDGLWSDIFSTLSFPPVFWETA